MPRSFALAAALSAALAGAGIVPAAAQGQQYGQQRGYQGSAGTGWFNTSLPRDRCVAIAADTMRQMGYINDPIAPDEDAVFAGRNGDIVLVRCITSRQMVQVFQHSVNGEELDPILNRLNASLGAGRASPTALPAQPQQPSYQPQPQAPYQQPSYGQQPGGGLPMKPR
ncbi:hypothetical protein M0638_12000 [Roseomonas sp. NAR14]|uniref:Uncharacterized protein n=1 Tax=Roseomonas acroporae TaxID=2937791 RepID=A0A9X1Y8M1_9PROT|nr:hypothetical protein [Roseomonas acroporae]MCK8785107.1 hypothetical protein [Roseomonas acroporae]